MNCVANAESGVVYNVTDPNKLTIPQLRQPLIAFGVRLDQGERRTQLFQRYVRLARIESPESVERWTGQDSLGAPLPGQCTQLVLIVDKSFLTPSFFFQPLIGS